MTPILTDGAQHRTKHSVAPIIWVTNSIGLLQTLTDFDGAPCRKGFIGLILRPEGCGAGNGWQGLGAKKKRRVEARIFANPAAPNAAE